MFEKREAFWLTAHTSTVGIGGWGKTREALCWRSASLKKEVIVISDGTTPEINELLVVGSQSVVIGAGLSGTLVGFHFLAIMLPPSGTHVWMESCFMSQSRFYCR